LNEIKKDIKINKTIQDVKDKFDKDIKSQKKKQTLEIKSSLSQIKNTVESHFSRLEQVAYKISGFEDKTDIKENT
jgi:archaellum component FlaC